MSAFISKHFQEFTAGPGLAREQSRHSIMFDYSTRTFPQWNGNGFISSVGMRSLNRIIFDGYCDAVTRDRAIDRSSIYVTTKTASPQLSGMAGTLASSMFGTRRHGSSSSFSGNDPESLGRRIVQFAASPFALTGRASASLTASSEESIAQSATRARKRIGADSRPPVSVPPTAAARDRGKAGCVVG